MSNSNSNKQVLLSVIGVAILVVAVVGVSFAFFNYTRTGPANTIRTGTISFATDQSVINVNNVFPIDASTVGTDTDNVKTATVEITGNTNYSNGIDFTITAEDVDITVGSGQNERSVPLHIVVTQEGLNNVTAKNGSGAITLGTFDIDHPLEPHSVLAEGKIPANTTVNGSIKVQVYLDKAEVAITDTYDPTSVDSNTNQHKPTDYNGTTSTWVAGRTVLTTAEWNALANDALSFKIRATAEDGL